jgi:hypothetical protein
LNSTKHYQLAQSVLRREDKLLDVDVELPETKWLDELRYRYEYESSCNIASNNMNILILLLTVPVVLTTTTSSTTSAAAASASDGDTIINRIYISIISLRSIFISTIIIRTQPLLT